MLGSWTNLRGVRILDMDGHLHFGFDQIDGRIGLEVISETLRFSVF